MIGVPTNVTDVLEISRHANIFLVQPFLPSFVDPALLLVLGDARLQSGASTQTIQGLGWRNTCTVALLLLFFVRLSLLPSLFSLQQLLLNRLPENVRLPLICKVETDLSIVPLKGVEVGSGRLVLELVVDLLVKDECLSVHVKDPDVVGSLEVVLDKADHATGPFVPSVTVTWPLTSVHLHNCGGKSLTSVPHQSLHHLVFLSGEQP